MGDTAPLKITLLVQTVKSTGVTNMCWLDDVRPIDVWPNDVLSSVIVVMLNVVGPLATTTNIRQS